MVLLTDLRSCKPAGFFFWCFLLSIVLLSQNLDFPYTHRSSCSYPSLTCAFASVSRTQPGRQTLVADPFLARAGGVWDESKCTAWRPAPTGKRAPRLLTDLGTPCRCSLLSHPLCPRRGSQWGRGIGGSLIAGAGGDVRWSGDWHGAGRASEWCEIEADKSLSDVEGAVIRGRENRGASSSLPSIGSGKGGEGKAPVPGGGGRHFWWMVWSQPWKLQQRKTRNKAKRKKVPGDRTIACLNLLSEGAERGWGQLGHFWAGLWNSPRCHRLLCAGMDGVSVCLSVCMRWLWAFPEWSKRDFFAKELLLLLSTR